MSKHESELPCLPAPDESLYRDGEVMATVDIPSHTYKGEGAKPVVYGRDLNSSDLLLLGVNKSLKQIMAREYDIDEDFDWEYPEAFSTTSRKVIINNGGYKYFVKEKPKYCCNPYSLDLAAQFQAYLSERSNFVPKIITINSGDPYLEIGNTYFFTTEFKEGRIFNASLTDIENAGAALGIMHTLSRDFSFPNPRNIHASDDSLEFVDLADRLLGAENDEWRPEAIHALKMIIDCYKDHVDDDVEYIVNHGDYAPFNLVYDNYGYVVAVNDFDNVNFRPRTRDIAGAILSFCDGLSYAGATSTLRKPIATSLNMDKVISFINGYTSNSYALTEKEKHNLVGEIMIRWAKIMALGIVRGDFNYFDVLNALSFQSYIEKNIPGII